VVAAVAAVAVFVIVTVSSSSTDCFADFPSKEDATRVLTEAHAIGLSDTDLIEHRRLVSIRISSGETGDDAREFRDTVRGLVAANRGRLEKNTPCIERPFFT
jgi:hypothetical protein